MDKQTLQNLVEELSLTYFNRPFRHKATFNLRLRTTGGRYHTQTHHLDFNIKILEHFGEEEFVGVIKHELCHYHLHLLGKGYRHSDEDFKCLLEKVGGSRYVKSLLPHIVEKFWHYHCQGCGHDIYRQRRFNTARFICRQCQNKFILRGKKEVPHEISNV